MAALISPLQNYAISWYAYLNQLGFMCLATTIMCNARAEALVDAAFVARLVEDFDEAPMANTFQFDAVFEDGALYKHGVVGQGVYSDPKRDFVGVYFSTNGYVPPYGEDKMPGYLRRAAKLLAGK